MRHLSYLLTGMLAMALLATSLRAQDGKGSAPTPRQTEPAAGPNAPGVASAVWKNDFGLDVVRLSPRVAVFYGGPWDNAIVALATRKGIVVVDAPFSRTMAGAFREAIRAEFKRDDFAYLINTHEHVCHIGGNEAFADVPIVGHESLRRETLTQMADAGRATKVCEMSERQLETVRKYFLERDPKKLEGPDFAAYEKGWRVIQADLRGNAVLIPPTITFDKELTLQLGDVAVRLIYYGYTHGIADTIVSIPEENLVLTAGVFDPTHVPVLNAVTEEATPAAADNWFVVMRDLLNGTNEETKFLASHGRAVMKKEQCVQSVAYLEGIWKGVRGARSKGRTLEEAKSAVPLGGFPTIAKMPNEALRGSEWENLDIHGHNIEHLWKILDRAAR